MKQKHSLTYRILTGFTPRSKCHQLLQAILNTLWLEVCSYSPFPHYFLLYCSKFVTALLNSLGSDFGFIQVELKSDLACCIWICGWFKHLSGEQMLTLFSNLNYHKLEPKWCNDIGEVMRERERCVLKMSQYVPDFPIPTSLSVLLKCDAGGAVQPCQWTEGGTRVMFVWMY